MRAVVRAIVRSRCVGAAVEKIGDKHACSTLMGGIGCSKVVTCNAGMGLVRKRPYPFHMPMHFYSSETNGSAAGAADGLDLVKDMGDYAVQFLKSHPAVLEFAACYFTTFLIYQIVPRVLMYLRSESVKYNQYEKCIILALANTERQLLKFYPMAAIGLVAFSKMSILIAPSMKAHISQVWQGAAIASVLTFLHVFRENFVVEAKKNENLIDPKWISNFDKISSISLISLGVLGAAEVAGLSLQSLATISGAGGVLTAFAGKDVIGNVLNGFSLHFADRFSVGEFIKVGSVEGTVVEIGLTSTSLINRERLPVTVPNSYFLGQVVVNMSRATVLSSIIKIPLRMEDAEKLAALTCKVNVMLKTNPAVTLEKSPCCYISRVGKLYGELLICYETKHKNEGAKEFEQTIMLETLKIMSSIGVEVGDALPSGELEALLDAAQIIKSRGAAYTG